MASQQWPASATPLLYPEPYPETGDFGVSERNSATRKVRCRAEPHPLASTAKPCTPVRLRSAPWLKAADRSGRSAHSSLSPDRRVLYAGAVALGPSGRRPASRPLRTCRWAKRQRHHFDLAASASGPARA